MIRILATCAWALLAAGCNIATVAEQPSATPRNECRSDSDCSIGSCRDRICVTTKAGFDTILFDVSPPANFTSAVGAQSLKTMNGLRASSSPLSLRLDGVAHISGTVTAPDGCTPSFFENGKTLVTSSDRTIPALITVVPSAGAIGLFASPISVPATLPDQSTWSFKLNVPPGSYDVYIQPPLQVDARCPVPPQLLRGYTVTGKVSLNIALPVPQLFELHVSWPQADGRLDGWSADMLDSKSGDVISNRVLLAAGGKKTDYVADLAWSKVVTTGVEAEELVRISPPDGVTAPVILLSRSGLGLSSANSGTLDRLNSLPTPVHISAQVTAMESPTPSAATVTLVATKLDGIEPGVIASFVRTISVGADGAFELDVLPGTYHVTAVPTGGPKIGGLGAATADWVVGATPEVQAGRVIELGNILTINGVAEDPSGTVAMAGAQVEAIPSPSSIVVDLLKQALGEPTYVPRGSTNTADTAGNFAVFVDAGTYDFSIRPPASSGYAWLVSPQVKVGASVGLDILDLPPPVLYTGTVSMPGSTTDSDVMIPGALIDAYIYTHNGAYTSDATQADSLLQIAEARTEQDGSFKLLIPAALNSPPSP